MPGHELVEYWIKKGKQYGYTHMLVLIDKFDMGVWPLYVDDDELSDWKKRVEETGEDAVVEVYILSPQARRCE